MGMTIGVQGELGSQITAKNGEFGEWLEVWEKDEGRSHFFGEQDKDLDGAAKEDHQGALSS